jgi:hypothetical protein
MAMTFIAYAFYSSSVEDEGHDSVKMNLYQVQASHAMQQAQVWKSRLDENGNR